MCRNMQVKVIPFPIQCLRYSQIFVGAIAPPSTHLSTALVFLRVPSLAPGGCSELAPSTCLMHKQPGSAW